MQLRIQQFFILAVAFHRVPSATDQSALQLALSTNQITVSVPTVPNQPLLFADENTARQEDAIIAYSFDKYLDGGDDQWPVLLPMVKSAVRAMDTAQESFKRVKIISCPILCNRGSKRDDYLADRSI